MVTFVMLVMKMVKVMMVVVVMVTIAKVTVNVKMLIMMGGDDSFDGDNGGSGNYGKDEDAMRMMES